MGKPYLKQHYFKGEDVEIKLFEDEGSIVGKVIGIKKNRWGRISYMVEHFDGEATRVKRFLYEDILGRVDTPERLAEIQFKNDFETRCKTLSEVLLKADKSKRIHTLSKMDELIQGLDE